MVFNDKISCIFIGFFNEKFPFFEIEFVSCTHWKQQFSCRLNSLLHSCYFLMEPLSKLWNMMDILFRKTCKWNRGFNYLVICIVPQIPRKNASRHFSQHSKMFYSVQNNFLIKGREKIKTWFYCFLRLSLNEIWTKVQNFFQLSRTGLTSLQERNYHKVFLPRSIAEL